MMNLASSMMNMVNGTIESSETYKKWRLTIAIEADSRRPLKCKYCRRSYKYKLSLKVHMKEAHMTRPVAGSDRYNMFSKKRHYLEPQRVRLSTVDTVKSFKQKSTISHYKPARKFSVIIQNPNVLENRRSSV